ncbi:hypothetical protein FIBSPDRAFT_738612, partial [Athelia psychrophila]
CNLPPGTCYSGAGFIMGSAIVGDPSATTVCNLGLRTCMATCGTMVPFDPTP